MVSVRSNKPCLQASACLNYRHTPRGPRTAFPADPDPIQNMARLHRSLALLLPALSVACVDGTPVSPSIESGPLVGIPAMECVIDVEREDMTCAPPEPVQNRLAIAAN